jgi:integrase
MFAPYINLSPSTLSSILTIRMREAKINIRNRKHGPHAWRHSLSGKLMEMNTPINIISGVLGHSSIVM